METEEMRLQALAVAGREMVFPSFTIRGFPGFNVVTLYLGQNTVYEPDAQQFTFQTTAALVVEHSITPGDTFVFSEGSYSFDFSIPDIYPDLEGWCIIRVELQDYESV